MQQCWLQEDGCVGLGCQRPVLQGVDPSGMTAMSSLEMLSTLLQWGTGSPHSCIPNVEGWLWLPPPSKVVLGLSLEPLQAVSIKSMMVCSCVCLPQNDAG